MNIVDKLPDTETVQNIVGNIYEWMISIIADPPFLVLLIVFLIMLNIIIPILKLIYKCCRLMLKWIANHFSLLMKSIKIDFKIHMRILKFICNMCDFRFTIRYFYERIKKFTDIRNGVLSSFVSDKYLGKYLGTEYSIDTIANAKGKNEFFEIAIVSFQLNSDSDSFIVIKITNSTNELQKIKMASDISDRLSLLFDSKHEVKAIKFENDDFSKKTEIGIGKSVTTKIYFNSVPVNVIKSFYDMKLTGIIGRTSIKDWGVRNKFSVNYFDDDAKKYFDSYFNASSKLKDNLVFFLSFGGFFAISNTLAVIVLLMKLPLLIKIGFVVLISVFALNINLAVAARVGK